MYVTAKESQAAVRSDQQRQDSSIAKRMTLIVVTDAACWMPIIILGVISLAGVKIPPQVCFIFYSILMLVLIELSY